MLYPVKLHATYIHLNPVKREGAAQQTGFEGLRLVPYGLRKAADLQNRFALHLLIE
jgi:hypothetical protein